MQSEFVGLGHSAIEIVIDTCEVTKRYIKNEAKNKNSVLVIA